MKNKCIICGAPCRSKYCSDECMNASRRQKYREIHPAKEKPFFVFYDKHDFVKFCGTAKQLVSDGRFNRTNSVSAYASKIKKGEISGTVVVLR